MSNARRGIPALLLLLLLFARTGRSQDATECTCPEGRACYHYLNAPVPPPDDPCHCPVCRENRGACSKRLPEGWDSVCADNDRMECFLRRHAASWGLTCSVMIDEPECACRNPHPEWCPRCGSDGADGRDPAALATIRRQRERERDVFGRADLVIVTSPHFYLVTDIPRLKIRTQDGRHRRMGMHELAHVYAQRAEIAYEDFAAVFGDRIHDETRMAIYLCRRTRTREDLSRTYFGLDLVDFTYGSYGTRTVAAGLCQDGTAISLGEYPGDDDLHLRMRHNIGHLLMSRWLPAGSTTVWPTWVYQGGAHWLERLPEKFRDRATFHFGEGRVESDDGSDWPKYLRRLAADPGLPPMQRFLDSSRRDSLGLDEHRRVWSWFDLFLAEDREPFLSLLARMRAGQEGRAALEAAFGCTPEELDRRWKDRVLGRRGSLAPTPEEIDAAHPDSPGARRRDSLRDEGDPESLAARIRALERVREPLTAATLAPFFSHESELVRQAVVMRFGDDPAPDVRAWMREEGTAAGSPAVRAGIARALGTIPDPDAGPALAALLADEDWTVRVQAARALGRVGFAPALRDLAALLEDASATVRIAALDALGRFGNRAGFAWSGVAGALSAPEWQVRSAAAECLGALGELRAVDALIDRMEAEGGRIRLDVRDALTRLIGDDLGSNPKYWRDWWEREKERHGGIPPASAMGKPSRPEDGNYAPPPTFYGLRVFSDRVAYLVDASGSMLKETTIDPDWMKRSRRDYPPHASRFELASCEVERSLRSLDPRAAFRVMFFADRAGAVNDGMSVASARNVDGAVNRLRAACPGSFSGERSVTNYVDALRLLLDRKKDEPATDRLRDTADTACFLTDGYPTAGDITDPDMLRSWFRELNESARIRLHVIAFGEVATRHRFLKALAEENGGTFVLVPETNR